MPGRVDSLGDVALGFFRDDATFHLPNLITDLVHKLTRVGDDLGRARSSVTSNNGRFIDLGIQSLYKLKQHAEIHFSIRIHMYRIYHT